MIEEYEDRDEVADADEAEPVWTEERKTRGIAWLLAPIALGLVVGAALGDLWGSKQLRSEDLLSGGAIGAVLGGIVGAAIWAGFPYKR